VTRLRRSFDTHREKQKGDGRRLQVRAESQQTAIAILHDELAAVPWHVDKSPKSGGECGSVRKLEGSKVGMLKREAKADPSLRSGWQAKGVSCQLGAPGLPAA